MSPMTAATARTIIAYPYERLPSETVATSTDPAMAVPKPM
jgi:hypothetical protein